MTNLPSDISALIEKSLNENPENLEIKVHRGNKKGEGYIGEIIFASVKNKLTDKECHLVVKKVFSTDIEATRQFLSGSYMNEIHFYTKLWPEMQTFQKAFPKVAPLDILAKCFGVSTEAGTEKIILDNLKYKNYQVHPKQKPLSDELYENIFKLYGKFHAISFAYKHYRPQSFLELAKMLKNNWIGFTKTNLIITGIADGFKLLAYIFKQEKEEGVVKKILPYIENGVKIFDASHRYDGPYSVIVHGDCWSNNQMFKYNESNQLQDIKLIDFQMCMLGSPVYDLTYTFYSGASKETMSKWEMFLKIYHHSLSQSLKEYNLNVEDIYPYEELKKEWKQQSQFGFIMSILIWGAKFVEEQDVQDLDQVNDETSSTKILENQEFIGAYYNLAKHFYDNDFLL